MVRLLLLKGLGFEFKQGAVGKEDAKAKKPKTYSYLCLTLWEKTYTLQFLQIPQVLLPCGLPGVTQRYSHY